MGESPPSGMSAAHAAHQDTTPVPQLGSVLTNPNGPPDWADLYPPTWDNASCCMPLTMGTGFSDPLALSTIAPFSTSEAQQIASSMGFPSSCEPCCHPWDGNPQSGNSLVCPSMSAPFVVVRDFPGMSGHEREFVPHPMAPAAPQGYMYQWQWAFGGLHAQVCTPPVIHEQPRDCGPSVSEDASRDNASVAKCVTKQDLQPSRANHNKATKPYARDSLKSTSSSQHSSGAHTAAEMGDDADSPERQAKGTLDLGLYNWLFAVLYPRQRPNRKDERAPIGKCKLCTTFCRRSGSLQQHVQIIHRQRIARKFKNKQPHSRALAFAFVVAHLQANLCSTDGVPRHEIDQFLNRLRACPPSGLVLTDSDEFPLLERELSDVISRSEWLGAKCERCGSWLAKTGGLREHRNSCVG